VVACPSLDGATGPAVGARFAARNKVRGGPSRVNKPVITRLEPDRAISWARTEPFAGTVEWSYQFQRQANGTLATESYRVTRPITRIGWLIIGTATQDRRAQLRAAMEQTLQRIRATIEQHVPAESRELSPAGSPGSTTPPPAAPAAGRRGAQVNDCTRVLIVDDASWSAAPWDVLAGRPGPRTGRGSSQRRRGRAGLRAYAAAGGLDGPVAAGTRWHRSDAGHPQRASRYSGDRGDRLARRIGGGRAARRSDRLFPEGRGGGRPADAICAARAGRPTLAPEAGQALVRQTTAPGAPRDGLTQRERDVLKLLVEGSSNPKIAERLVLSDPQ